MCSLLIGICCVLTLQSVQAQSILLSGKVQIAGGDERIKDAEIQITGFEISTRTNKEGEFQLTLPAPGIYNLECYAIRFSPFVQTYNFAKDTFIEIRTEILSQTLEGVEIKETNNGVNGFTHLRGVEESAIYEGRKTEVIIPSALTANLAANNSRQIYARVAGLNIWESDAAGLQLGIGGRGLSPNRTSNFNTRQNGYDISADPLGYPESYYTPPAELIKRIEVVRGAASLQYGTQFGGLLNFVLNDPPKDKKIELLTRHTGGSFGLYNTFNSIGGSVGRWSYMANYEYKRSNGWRPNSDFDLHLVNGQVKYVFSPAVRIGAEYTFMNYLAHQPGGLTDAQFEADPRQSNRERNWFKVRWNLMALTLDWKISEKTNLNMRNYGLVAGRDALGNLTNISRADAGEARDLLMDDYANYGHETRLVHRYAIKKLPATFLVGYRIFRGHTERRQGYGNDGSGPDFEYINPDNLEGSAYTFPNLNLALFGEHIFYVHKKFTITPGFRLEYIKTRSEGAYRRIVTDGAGNVLVDETIPEERLNKRPVFLAGTGLSYKPTENLEVYGNISQNYRAINFNDLRVNNPNFDVDPELKDEKGFTADLGFRGQYKDWLQWDATFFYLQYNDRIGEVLQNRNGVVVRYRTNISDARNIGIETFAEIDLVKACSQKETPWKYTVFSNIAYIDARYVRSQEKAYDRKKVELVPPLTAKLGFSFGYDAFQMSFQYAFTQRHYTDATNAETPSPNAVDGPIQSYSVADLSASYAWKWLKVEAGINNLFNNTYFTRRAVGYPGPGIIPSDGINFYLGLQLRWAK